MTIECRQLLRWLTAAFVTSLGSSAAASPLPGPDGSVIQIPSKDGTLIAVECAGTGPSLVIVHGGIGDRTRWTPMFPLFSSRFTVCAMDRRGHGASGDSPDYTLQKEAEDVAAVVNSRPGTVFAFAGPRRPCCRCQNGEDDSGRRARAGLGDLPARGREALAKRRGRDAVAAVLARTRGHHWVDASSDACNGSLPLRREADEHCEGPDTACHRQRHRFA